MKIVIRFTTLLTLLALGACGGGSSDSPPADGGGNNNPPPPPVVVAPVITTQPVDASADTGSTVTFTVVASGDALTYQWKKSGTAIAGATGASYTTPALAAGDDQSLYAVTVTNAGGSVTSNNAKVTVTTAPPPSGGGGDGGGAGGGSDNGTLQPLSGPTEPIPTTAAPMAATPAIGGVSPDHRYLLSWDPTSNGVYTFGFLHYSGAETRLYVPVGSFLDEAWITTADVTSIGPAVTSVVAAIDIEPGDYAAEKTLTANFMIPDAMMATIDPAQLIGFAADSDGSNLHMVPIVVGDLGASLKRPAIKLDHLGIVGIAVATPEQQAALAAAWPTDPGDRLIASLAPSLTARWRNLVAPASASLDIHLMAKTAAAAGDDGYAAAVLRGYYNDTVVPAFAAADADPSQIPAAIQVGFGFLRMATLSGEDGEGGAFQVVASQVWARIQALMDVYADYIASQCRATGSLDSMQKMLGVMRQLQMLGDQSKSDELEEILPQCSRLRIDFRYEYTESANWIEGYNAGPGTIGGDDALEEQLHAVVEGSRTFELDAPATDATLRLTTLEWDRKRTRDVGGVTRYTYVSEGDTPPWSVPKLSVPIIRTRGGTPSTAITLFLPAFRDVGPNADSIYRPFEVTTTSVYTAQDGTVSAPVLSPHTALQLEIFVPPLPADGQFNFGPMVIPGSGSASSSASRVVPVSGGAKNETETVMVTISRAE